MRQTEHRTQKRATQILLLASAVLTATAGCSTHQDRVNPTLLKASAVRSDSTAQSLKVEKYKLANGLTVILHEDRSLPQVTVNLWYAVGALNEPPGRTGFAHLFEHLMFMGTRRVPGGEFDHLMESAGGSNNATTSFERTNYFSKGPSSMLPTLLWLEADRMEELGKAMDQKKLDLQRDVVRNELRETVENSPYGKADQAAYALMYPAGHPYHQGVIGTHEDLESATVDNVRDFFATFYTPDNCSLVVAGNFNPAQVKPLIEQLFGSLPRGNAPSRRHLTPVRLGQVKRATYLDKVPAGRVTLLYHSPGYYQPGDGEMDVIASMLAEGPGSRLYDRLVEREGLAGEVSAYQESTWGQSLFRISVTARPGVDLARIEQIIDEELNKLLSQGPTEEEVLREKAKIELHKLSALQELGDRADKFNEWQFYLGTPNGLDADLNRYRKLTVTDVKHWAGSVLTPGSRLIYHVLPDGFSSQAGPRDQRPADLDKAPFILPLPERAKLSNGVEILLWRREGLPLVTMRVVLEKPGTLLESVAAAGTANLATHLLMQGAGSSDAARFATETAKLGAQIDSYAGYESLGLTLRCLHRSFPRAAGLVADALLRPRLSPDDFSRERELTADAIAQELEDPTSIARRVGLQAQYGPSNRRGVPVVGTVESVKQVELEQAKALLDNLRATGKARVLVAGDLTLEETRETLERLLGSRPWPRIPAPADDAALPSSSPSSTRNTPRVIYVDRPGATQTTISIFAPGLRSTDDRRTQFELVNTLFGGSFTSRLNSNLREDKGFTYGIGSGFASFRETGHFRLSTNVKAEVTGEALIEVVKELRRLSTGDLTEAEVTKARETLRNDIVSRFATADSILAQADSLLLAGEDLQRVERELQQINSASLADLESTARTLVSLNQCVIVLVGEKEKILAAIEQAGLPQPEEKP